MPVLAAARVSLARFQDTRDPAYAWCLVDDEATQQRYVYAGGTLHPASDRVTVQGTPMTMGDVCVMVATQQQLILAAGEPVVSESLFIRRIRPKYVSLAGEARVTALERKVIMEFYALVYADTPQPNSIQPESMQPVTSIDPSVIPPLLQGAGVPLIVRLSQKKDDAALFDIALYRRARNMSTYYNKLHTFLISKADEDRERGQEYFSYCTRGPKFVSILGSVVTSAAKHMDFLAPHLAGTASGRVAGAGHIGCRHATLDATNFTEQVLQNIEAFRARDAKVVENPKLTTLTDCSDTAKMYSGKLSVISPRVVADAKLLPKTLEIEKAGITSFLHQSTFTVSKDFFATRGQRIFSQLESVAKQMDTYTPDVFQNSVFLSSLYGSLLHASHVSKIMRIFEKYFNLLALRGPTDSVRASASKLQRPTTFVSRGSLQYDRFIGPFVQQSPPIVIDSTLKQLLSAMYRRPHDSKASDAVSRADKTETRQQSTTSALTSKFSKQLLRYIIVPSLYSKCSITEKNALYFFVGGEFRVANRLEKVKDYRYPQYEYVHQKAKSKKLGTAAFTLDTSGRDHSSDDMVLVYKGTVLVFTSDVGKITETEWESGAVLCTVLDGHPSQFSRVRSSNAKKGQLSYVLSKSLGVHCYLKGENPMPEPYKNSGVFPIQLSSVDHDAVQAQVKMLWAQIESRMEQ